MSLFTEYEAILSAQFFIWLKEVACKVALAKDIVVRQINVKGFFVSFRHSYLFNRTVGYCFKCSRPYCTFSRQRLFHLNQRVKSLDIVNGNTGILDLCTVRMTRDVISRTMNGKRPLGEKKSHLFNAWKNFHFSNLRDYPGKGSAHRATDVPWWLGLNSSSMTSC